MYRNDHKDTLMFIFHVKQTTGSLYFWAAHLAGPRWGPFASWCCAWLETIGLIAGIGAQVVIHPPLFPMTTNITDLRRFCCFIRNFMHEDQLYFRSVL